MSKLSTDLQQVIALFTSGKVFDGAQTWVGEKMPGLQAYSTACAGPRQFL